MWRCESTRNAAPAALPATERTLGMAGSPMSLLTQLGPPMFGSSKASLSVTSTRRAAPTSGTIRITTSDTASPAPAGAQVPVPGNSADTDDPNVGQDQIQPVLGSTASPPRGSDRPIVTESHDPVPLAVVCQTPPA